ncbi:MAG: TolC family protein [Acidobacteriaceae bacterium]|nr:TolC family protein [Acidobacteriaceae bacterium]MBV9037680.1 TolC family protein [Acidobacteriaceae bacterium]
MRRLKAPLCLLCSLLVFASSLPAQNAIRIDPPQGGLGWLTRPYQRRTVPPINLTNTDRLQSLIRAGNLYLSGQDVIALALENNLDIEIQRYGPLLYRQITQRAEGGNLLRDVGVGITQGPQSVSLTGVSLNASGGGAATTAVSSQGGVLTQVGPAQLTFDPTVTFNANFAHSTSPFSNTVLTGNVALVNDSRSYQGSYSQNWASGTSAILTYGSTRNKYNSNRYAVNPYNTGALDLVISQNFLQGFGMAVNRRNILTAKNNERFSDLQFKQQVITTVSAVLNLYWDLVSFNQDLKARRDELATAQALYNDNKRQVEIGTLAPIEVTRAEAQVYSSQQDLLVSQTNLLQQETVLKNALSRNGVASPELADVHIIPLDTFKVPGNDQQKPIEALLTQALANRVDIAQSKINIENYKTNLVAIKNSLKPTLQGFVEVTNNGLAGNPNFLPGAGGAYPGFVGGYGDLLSQIFRRNYPNYSAGFSLNIFLRNRAAQSDYTTTVLQMRQNELTLQRSVNQVRVDVQNAVIGLQQARARYDSAQKARILQRQTLEADQKKYTLGASTVFQVVQDQQALATAESNETQALANFSHAQIAFDQAMGTTLEVNNISITEALSGHVGRPSVLPAKLPEPQPEQKQ